MNLWRDMGLEGKRVLIVHHDDLGITEAQNRAYLDLGYPTGSILMPGAWAPQLREGDLGVHLTLTSEWAYPRMRPLTTGRTLHDEQGYLWQTVEDVWTHVDADDAEAEMRAQIEAAKKLRIDVTHIDTHMGAVGRPDLIEAYQRLALQDRIPAVLPDAVSIDRAPLPQELKTALEAVLEQSTLPRVRVLDAYGVKPEEARLRYIELLSQQGPGVYHLIHHAAVPTAEGRMLPDWKTRKADLETLADSHVIRVLNEFVLLTYRDMREALRSYI
ncbi:MAG TPA: ChbG/HpnK family deacetylase [Symbiobacteriaceae bacterium]|nr:ChbG/HpnK family deacetylase [Symbiobacteriaceae bacterium]